jgi:hypothetical protein
MGSRKSLNQALFWQFAQGISRALAPLTASTCPRLQGEMSATARALHLERLEARTLILLCIFLLEIRNTIRLHVAKRRPI